MERRTTSRQSGHDKKVVKKFKPELKKLEPRIKERLDNSHRKGETRASQGPIPSYKQVLRTVSRKRKPDSILASIRDEQSKVGFAVPKANFSRVVRSVADDLFGEEHPNWSRQGMEALQTAAEGYMIGLFEDSYLCTLHRDRVTLYQKDMALARRIRGLGDPGNR